MVSVRALLCSWIFLVAALSFAGRLPGEEPGFDQVGVQFVQKHCAMCHGEKEQEAELALHGFRDAASVAADRTIWDNALKLVQTGQMPPPDRPRPSVDEIDA